MSRLWCAIGFWFFSFPLSGGHAAITAIGPTKISVSQSITEVQAGTWLYEFSFTNSDVSPIWHFGVYTSFETASQTGSGLDGTHYLPITDSAIASGPYDPTSVDPTLTHLTVIYDLTHPAWSNPLQVGLMASLSFTSAQYDASPKLFFYETVASGYARQNTWGTVAAYDYTAPIPEPTSLLIWSAIALGGLGLAYRRRRKQTT